MPTRKFNAPAYAHNPRGRVQAVPILAVQLNLPWPETRPPNVPPSLQFLENTHGIHMSLPNTNTRSTHMSQGHNMSTRDVKHDFYWCVVLIMVCFPLSDSLVLAAAFPVEN
jgi:hypothetical protein